MSQFTEAAYTAMNFNHLLKLNLNWLSAHINCTTIKSHWKHLGGNRKLVTSDVALTEYDLNEWQMYLAGNGGKRFIRTSMVFDVNPVWFSCCEFFLFSSPIPVSWNGNQVNSLGVPVVYCSVLGFFKEQFTRLFFPENDAFEVFFVSRVSPWQCTFGT